jgi:hypothetical protein
MEKGWKISLSMRERAAIGGVRGGSKRNSIDANF